MDLGLHHLSGALSLEVVTRFLENVTARVLAFILFVSSYSPYTCKHLLIFHVSCIWSHYVSEL